MDIGMLWYDDDGKRTLAEKLKRAVDFYAGKHQKKANVCFVNPAMLEKGKPVTLDGVSVRPSRTVIVNHFWLGVDLTAKGG